LLSSTMRAISNEVLDLSSEEDVTDKNNWCDLSSALLGGSTNYLLNPIIRQLAIRPHFASPPITEISPNSSTSKKAHFHCGPSPHLAIPLQYTTTDCHNTPLSSPYCCPTRLLRLIYFDPVIKNLHDRER
jgi:hypothetical protein